MKYNKTTKIQLPSPKPKSATYFDPLPRHVGKFALVTEETHLRGHIFMPGDLVRISYNQRYVAGERSLVQVISIPNEVPPDRRYYGNHYVINIQLLKYIDTIPPGTNIRLMSKEYPIPCETILTVENHANGEVTVKYDGKKYKISDKFIEGIPTTYERTDSNHLFGLSREARSAPPAWLDYGRYPDDTDDELDEDGYPYEDEPERHEGNSPGDMPF